MLRSRKKWRRGINPWSLKFTFAGFIFRGYLPPTKINPSTIYPMKLVPTKICTSTVLYRNRAITNNLTLLRSSMQVVSNGVLMVYKKLQRPGLCKGNIGNKDVWNVCGIDVLPVWSIQWLFYIFVLMFNLNNVSPYTFTALAYWTCTIYIHVY